MTRSKRKRAARDETKAKRQRLDQNAGPTDPDLRVSIDYARWRTADSVTIPADKVPDRGVVKLPLSYVLFIKTASGGSGSGQNKITERKLPDDALLERLTQIAQVPDSGIK